MNASLEEARQLYAAAQRDMTALDMLVASGRAPNETIGFLAYLATAGGSTLPIGAESIGQLNPYAVALRYEGSEVHWVTKQQAMALVDSLNAFAVQFLR